MNETLFLEISQKTIWVSAQLVGPLLIISTIVGLAVSIFQAVTQINEMTLTFIPKIIVVGVVLIVLGPAMVNIIMDFTKELFLAIPTYIK